MESRFVRRIVTLAGFAIFTLAVLSSAGGQAQSATAAAPVVSPAKSAPAAAAEHETASGKDDASHQGIKVHGHWKIVVKNPDGSVAQTREFENSLQSFGAAELTRLVIGNATSAGHGIILSTTGTSICATTYCAIVTNPNQGSGYGVCHYTGTTTTCVSGMTETLAGANNLLTLAGQMTASQAGSITNVATDMVVCNGSEAATSCLVDNAGGVSAFPFTATTISAVSVNAGQIVQVTVTISFS